MALRASGCRATDVALLRMGPSVQRRAYHEYVRVRAPGGSCARVPLKPGQTFGALASRGERSRQEDAVSYACVMLPCEQLRQSIVDATPRGQTRDPWFGWSCMEAGGPDLGAQVVWFACFDGHGGPSVSQRLAARLHAVFEAAEPDMVTDTVRYMRSLGGYFRRYSGGVLERWVRKDRLGRGAKREAPTPQRYASLSALAASSEAAPERALEHYVALDGDEAPGARHTERIAPPDEMRGKELTLKERATLAWLMVRRALTQMDREIQQNEAYQGAGSTASVVLVHSLDKPAAPWYASQYISLTTVHLGDTRFVLCPVRDGRAVPLTTFHHPDDPVEAERLSRLGAGVVTDSFGENRWMGTLANTRAFGDADAKRFGVTPEPDVTTHLLRGSDVAFVVGFSDGISDVASDQEIVDLCCGASHPQEAAKRVLRYAENLGAVDNATVVCAQRGLDARAAQGAAEQGGSVPR
ncbi:hypothetical protein CBS9595_004148 [Malassezia furfur]|nr:hypothetical protein CBS9595_004148 [Malassezia furfur]